MIQEIIAARSPRTIRALAAVFAAGLLTLFASDGLPADANWAGPVPGETLSLTAGFFQEEAARMGKSARLWGTIGLFSAAAVTGGWLGLIETPPAVTYMTYVLLAGSGLGAIQELSRRRHYSGLADALSADVAPAGAGAFWLRRPTADKVREELGSMQQSLKITSQSGLRAGCVVPVLFSGIAIYGLSAGTEQGEDLAGLAIGAALVMAVPSMLRYWSLKTRLARVNGLIDLLDRNLPTMERANE